MNLEPRILPRQILFPKRTAAPDDSPAKKKVREQESSWDRMDPRQCVVLVPVGQYVEPGCEEGLRELEKRGYEVRRTRGFSAIDVGRSQMASDALATGFEELMWIDSDIAFHPDDVEKLRGHQLPLMGGIYAKKSRHEFACAFLPGTESVLFGQGGKVMAVLYAGFGFMLTRKGVYETMQQKLGLSKCNQRFGSGMVPYFAPMTVEDLQGKWYLAEDYAFCERARLSEFQVQIDPSIRLWHVGSYGFGWEDAGSAKERYASYRFGLKQS